VGVAGGLVGKLEKPETQLPKASQKRKDAGWPRERQIGRDGIKSVIFCDGLPAFSIFAPHHRNFRYFPVNLVP
jgi:hypothetical protein